MKDKNFPYDIKNKSLNELKELANNIIESLENKKDLESSIKEYQELITLNNFIEKKFQNTSRELSKITKEKIKKILNKEDEKKVK
tara:strand:+ start:481 stop:735 length:255 start_codon:yes stop_codon:yes gene_type:complete